MGNSSVEAIAVRNTIRPKRRAARKRGKKTRLDFGRLPFQHRQLPISHIKTLAEKNSRPRATGTAPIWAPDFQWAAPRPARV